nr:hypothetical protein [Liquorilactobacillus satsumensis]
MTHTFVTDKLEKQLISYRHWFHEYPELATQEFKTTKKIKEILQSWNIRLLPTALPLGGSLLKSALVQDPLSLYVQIWMAYPPFKKQRALLFHRSTLM